MELLVYCASYDLPQKGGWVHLPPDPEKNEETLLRPREHGTCFLKLANLKGGVLGSRRDGCTWEVPAYSIIFLTASAKSRWYIGIGHSTSPICWAKFLCFPLA